MFIMSGALLRDACCDSFVLLLVLFSTFGRARAPFRAEPGTAPLALAVVRGSYLHGGASARVGSPGRAWALMRRMQADAAPAPRLVPLSAQLQVECIDAVPGTVRGVVVLLHGLPGTAMQRRACGFLCCAIAVAASPCG